MTSEDKKIDVAVIGGGIGGLCLAIGLLEQKHLRVNIYEAAHKFAEIGAGVALGPNSQRAMTMITPKIHEAFMKQATHNTWESQRKTWFQFKNGVEGQGEGLVADLSNETGQTTVHRALFLDELVKLVPKEIAHFGKRVDKIVDNGSQGVTLHFKDDTTVTVDAVLGADGVHSPTRAFLLGPDHPATKPQFTNTVAYRGLVPMEKAKAVLGAEYAENSFIWPAQDELIMTYPISFGEIMNVVAIETGVKKWDHEAWTIPATVADLDRSFHNLSKTPAGVIALLKEESISAWSMWDMMIKAPFYNKGNVCMLGDAAHASTPYQGQGAGQAIEDGLVLNRLFSQITDKAQIPAAFEAYDHVRREHTQRVILTSRECGVIFSLQDPDAGSDMDKIGARVKHRMNWMWDNDLEAQNQKAIKIMKELLTSSQAAQ